jgi:hypothetical protein
VIIVASSSSLAGRGVARDALGWLVAIARIAPGRTTFPSAW